MESKFISIKIGPKRYRKIYLDSIQYCKADRSYCIIKTEEEEFTLSKPLKKLEELFELPIFLRVNRSYIINLQQCVELKLGSKPELVLSNGTIIKPNMEVIHLIEKAFKLD